MHRVSREMYACKISKPQGLEYRASIYIGRLLVLSNITSINITRIFKRVLLVLISGERHGISIYYYSYYALYHYVIVKYYIIVITTNMIYIYIYICIR